MTTAYDQASSQDWVNHRQLSRTSSVQAAKVSSGLGFDYGTAERGQSPESAKVLDFFRKLQPEFVGSIEDLGASIELVEDFSYNHIHLKPVFSVQVTYKHTGKLKPRQFPLDE